MTLSLFFAALAVGGCTFSILFVHLTTNRIIKAATAAEKKGKEQ